jgi:hypothetical protein
MADLETLTTNPQPQTTTAAPPPAEGQSSESHLSVVLKSVFWLLIVPGAVLYLVKWMLQSQWLMPS